MNEEILVGLVGAILGGAGTLLGKGMLGEILRSDSKQEETAVGQMAKILEHKSKSEDETRCQLIEALIKALNTIKEQSAAMQQIALSVQGHERDASLRWSQEQHDLKQIIKSVEDLEKLVTDVAIKFIREGKNDDSTVV